MQLNQKIRKSKELNIFIRYIVLFVLILFFSSEIFLYPMGVIFTGISYYFLKFFTGVEILANALHLANDTYFLIINACIAPNAYMLISIVFFTIPIKFKLLSKIWFKSVLTFTFFNLFRILFLMWVYVSYGPYYFEKYHLIFYEALSGVITALIIIYYLRKEKIKGVFPVFTDFLYLFKNLK